MEGLFLEREAAFPLLLLLAKPCLRNDECKLSFVPVVVPEDGKLNLLSDDDDV